MPIPTPEQEALQDPLIEPGDIRSLASGVLKAILAHPGLLAALGAMRMGYKPHAYLPPGKEIQDNFFDPQTGRLLSGDQIMRQGKDPWLGYERSFQPADLTIDYMPRGVRSSDQAARYMEAHTRKHSLNPYGNTDDGLFGTPRKNRGDELIP
jgi:hypothetical protein